MRWEVARRGAAIGVVFGIAAAAATVSITPALRDGATGFSPILELTALFVCVYAALGVAAGAAVATLGALGARIGAPQLARLGSARALWPLGGLALGLGAVNEIARSSDALSAWRHGIRAALIALALFALWRALRRSTPTSDTMRAVESMLALLLLPAVAGALLYARRPLPQDATDVATGGAFAVAPRFASEATDAFQNVRDPARPRVLLIGVDGASWDRIDRGIAAGQLPTFARLREQSVHAPLRSLVPTFSPLIWTSMMTGVAAPQHNIRDFYLTQLPRLGVENLKLPRSFSLLRKALDATGELRFVPVTSSLRRRKAIWNLADEGGLRTAVIGMWATWPPEALQHGAIVSDHASFARQQEWIDRGKTNQPHAGVTTHPPALAERLAPLQRAPDSVTREELATFVEVDDATWREFQQTRLFSKEAPLSAFRSSHLNDEFYARSAQRIWSEDRPDLLVLYLRAVDELSHFFYDAGSPEAAALGWSDRDIVRFGGVVDRIYQWTDRAIAALVDEALRDPNTLVVIVSDHGWEKEPDGQYNHSDAPPGILMLAGAGVCKVSCPPLDAPSIYDIAPTLLTRLGLPLSAELVGHPLDAAFTAPRAVTHIEAYGAPQIGATAIPSNTTPQFRQKLEALGYLRD